jgi:thioredoxin 1
MKIVTDADFEEVVLKSEKLVMVDFFTDGCGPCKMLAPMLEALASEHEDVDIVKIDASEGTVADAFGVSAVPTMVLIKDGQEVDRLEGLFPKPMLKKWIEENS